MYENEYYDSWGSPEEESTYYSWLDSELERLLKEIEESYYVQKDVEKPDRGWFDTGMDMVADAASASLMGLGFGAGSAMKFVGDALGGDAESSEDDDFLSYAADYLSQKGQGIQDFIADQYMEPGPDAEWLPEMGKAVGRGTMGLLSGVGDMATWAGEMLPEPGSSPEWVQDTGDWIAEKGKVASDFYKDLAQEYFAGDPEVFGGSFEDNPSMMRALAAMVEASPSLAAALGAGAIAGPSAAAIGLGGIAGAGTYTEARDKGLSPAEASKYGAASWAQNALLEKFGLDEILKGKSALLSAVKEGGTEAWQQFNDNMIAKYGFDDARELTEGLIESAIGGFGSGGVMGGVTQMIQGEDAGKRKPSDDDLIRAYLDQSNVGPQLPFDTQKQRMVAEQEQAIQNATETAAQGYLPDNITPDDYQQLVTEGNDRAIAELWGLYNEEQGQEQEQSPDQPGEQPIDYRYPESPTRYADPNLPQDTPARMTFTEWLQAKRQELGIEPTVIQPEFDAEESAKAFEDAPPTAVDSAATFMEGIESGEIDTPYYPNLDTVQPKQGGQIEPKDVELAQLPVQQLQQARKIFEARGRTDVVQKIDETIADKKNEIPQDLRWIVDEMDSELRSMQTIQGGTTNQMEAAGESILTNAPKTPKWFGDINKRTKDSGGFDRKTWETVLNKVKAGEPLTDRQSKYYQEIITEARKIAEIHPDAVATDDVDAVVKKGYEPVMGQNIPVTTLNQGDRLLIGNEVFRFDGIDDNGDAVFQDGRQIKVDPFETIQADGLKRTDTQPQQPMEAQNVKEAQAETLLSGKEGDIVAQYNDSGGYNIYRKENGKLVEARWDELDADEQDRISREMNPELYEDEGESDEFLTPMSVAVKKMRGMGINPENSGIKIKSDGEIVWPKLIESKDDDVVDIAPESLNKIGTDVDVTDAATETGMLYRGLNTPGKQAVFHDDGSIELLPAENFGGKQSGVSFTPYKPVAADYASRTKIAKMRNPGGMVIVTDFFDINDFTTEDSHELNYESGSYVIPAGRWKALNISSATNGKVALSGDKASVAKLNPAPQIPGGGSAVVTDHAEVQKIQNSIAEGEALLKSGRKQTGQQFSPAEIGAIQRSVDSAKTKIGQPPKSVFDLKPPEEDDIQFKEVYHGTPHTWQPEPGFPHGRPRLDKIFNKETVGEGAWAYGAGWYSAEEENIGEGYRPGPARIYVGKTEYSPKSKYFRMVLSRAKGDVNAAIKDAENLAADAEHIDMATDYWDVADELKDIKRQRKKVSIAKDGSLYKLDIPDDVIPQLLDWDKPLSEQSENIKNAARDNGISVNGMEVDQDGIIQSGPFKGFKRHDYNGAFYIEMFGKKHFIEPKTPKGSNFYKALSSKLGSDIAASEYLASIGIPGNTHGGVSRGATGAKYVIWDQKVLDRVALLERNQKKLAAMQESLKQPSNIPNTDIPAWAKSRNLEAASRDDGGFDISRKGKKLFTVRSVNPEEVQGMTGKPWYNSEQGEAVAGWYDSSNNLVAVVKKVGDSFTIDHEFTHFIDPAISPSERAVLDKAAGKAFPKLTKSEARASFVEQQLRNRTYSRESTIGKILQKIQDWIDSAINAFKPTARGIVRGVESGKVADRMGGSKAMTDGGPMFSKQSPQFQPVDTNSTNTDPRIQFSTKYAPQPWDTPEIQKSKKEIATALVGEFKAAIKRAVAAAKAGESDRKPGKQDISGLSRIFGLMSHFSEKVKPLNDAYLRSLQQQDDTEQLANSILNHEGADGREGTGPSRLSAMLQLRKTDKPAFKRFQNYINWKDTNKIGYRVSQNKETGKWSIWKTPDGKKWNHVKDVDDPAIGWMETIDLEVEDVKKLGFTDQQAQAVRDYREVAHLGYNLLKREIDKVISGYESAGKPLPEFKTMGADGKPQKINLKEALAKMGDQRGWFMPRIREKGKYAVTATGKAGSHRKLRFVQNKAQAKLAVQKYRQDGYESLYSKAKDFSNDVYEMAGQVTAVNAMLQTALDSMDLGKYGPKSLKELGLYGRWTGGKAGEGGTYILRGMAGQEYQEIFESFGGEQKEYKGKKEYYTYYQFDKAPADIEEQIMKEVFYAKGFDDTALGMGLTGELEQVFADFLRQRGAMKHKIGRDDSVGLDVWKGYEEDPLKAITIYTKGIAGATSKHQMALDLVKIISGKTESWPEFKARVTAETGTRPKYEDYKKHVDANRIDPREQHEAFGAAKVLLNEMLRNESEWDRLAAKIKTLVAIKYLGGRVFSGAVNLSALPTSAAAAISNYTGVPIHEVFKHIGNAFDQWEKFSTLKALSDENKTWAKRNITPKIAKVTSKNAPNDWWVDQALMTIYDKGWHKAQFNQDALSALRGGFGEFTDKMVQYSMFAMGISEKINRVGTLLGAYNAIRSRHKGTWDQEAHDAALEKAKYISDKAHGTYHKANKPEWAKGDTPTAAVMGAAYTFQKFFHTYLLNMKKYGWDQMDFNFDNGFWRGVGKGIAGNKSGLKNAAWLALSTSIFGGIGVTIPAKMIFAIAGLGGGPDDPEEAFYDWLDEKFGKTTSMVARQGPMGLTGVSLKGSVDAMIPMLDVNMQVTDLLGAPGALAQDLWEGGKNLTKGEYKRALEKILPVALGAGVRAGREYNHGVTTASNAPLFYGKEQVMPTLAESIIRGMGGNPARIAAIREKQWSEKQVEDAFQEWRRDIGSRIKKYYLSTPAEKRDPADYAEIVGEIAEFNAAAKNVGFYVPLITSNSVRATLKRASTPPKKEQMRRVYDEEDEEGND